MSTIDYRSLLCWAVLGWLPGFPISSALGQPEQPDSSLDVLPSPNRSPGDSQDKGSRGEYRPEQLPPPVSPAPADDREPLSRPVPQSHRPSLTTAGRRAYRLGPGDMLAIVVDGVLGSFRKPPVYFPKPGQDILPATGYPVQIDPKGQLDQIKVSGTFLVV